MPRFWAKNPAIALQLVVRAGKFSRRLDLWRGGRQLHGHRDRVGRVVLAEARQNFILKRLDQEGSVSIADLARVLGASRETIRRDLKLLATKELLRQTHGGAVVMAPNEPDIADRLVVNSHEKEVIGRRAAQLVTDGASLIIDSGSTTWPLVEALDERRSLTVYTNSLRVAQRLWRRNNNRIYLLGGEIQPYEDMTAGWDATRMLERYHAELAFISVNGLCAAGDTQDAGAQSSILGGVQGGVVLSDYHRDVAELHGRMILAADRPILLCDHSKIGRMQPFPVEHVGKLACLITDRDPDAPLAKSLHIQNTDCLVAK
ncbi:MAG TPA: DeoR/GlpR family DNA-binding transcription regulator [Terriglobales bacterium]|nr:DeoR/GlpR family DNA-binding transcription regulator [Terriglobales bacterium]